MKRKTKQTHAQIAANTVNAEWLKRVMPQPTRKDNNDGTHTWTWNLKATDKV